MIELNYYLGILGNEDEYIGWVNNRAYHWLNAKS